MAKKSRRKQQTGRVVAVAVLLLLGGVWLLARLNDPFAIADFTVEAWQAAERPEDRGLMSRDLIDNHVDDGDRPGEVRQTLGTPDNETVWPDSPRRLPWPQTYSYHVGSWPGDEEGRDAYVDIHFDRGGRVIKREISRR